MIVSLVFIAVGYNNGVSQRPALGWNTWCTMGTCGQGGVSPGKMSLHDVCNETEIKSIGAAMLSSGLYDMGYDRVNLDDCWVGENRNPDGTITWDPLRFPNGMKPVIDWLHERGLRFGLYSSMGSTTCNQNGRTWPGNATGTWPRHGSFGHYKEDAQTFAEWGVDYVKMDWCGDTYGHSSEELHRNFSKWLNATGRPMHLELCRGYKHPIPDYVAEVANSWRVAGDNWDFWPHTVSTIKDFINVSHLAGPFNWNYGDFLMTGGAGCNVFKAGDHCPGQTDAEYRTQFSVYVIAASPLIIGTDIRNMTQIMKDAFFNKELLAVNQDFKARAGDLVATFPAAQCAEASARRTCTAHVLHRDNVAGEGACSVKLTKQLSKKHVCVSGALGTFGCFDGNGTMWTSDGCRGVFECDGKTVTCNLDGAGRHTCDCSNPKPADDDVLLWARHLSDGSVAIGVTNLDAFAHDVVVPLSALGWVDAGAVSVRDLWALKDLGTMAVTVNITVASHDTAVLQLRKQREG